MTTINNGGTAFPVVAENGLGHVSYGMDLRDWFAAKAMHAIYMRLGGSPSAGTDHDGGLTYMAEGAYAMADAMLKARG